VKRCVAYLCVLVLSATGLTVALAPVAAAATVKVRLVAAIKNLPVAAETRTGYDRSKFRLWVDADGDCRDTRDEVLAAESLVGVRGCDIRVGKWRSYYDRQVTTRSSDFDIDHLVPLAEAWDSGARRWSAGTRQRYANDLGDPRSLVAVSASVNRSKSDQDPAQWQPRYDKCTYVRQWVAVKTRWSLKVNPAEKRALLSRASHCANTVLTVRRASIVTASSGTSGTSGGATGGSNDPRFSYCYQAVAAGYGPYYRGTDPEYWWYTDGDGDGVVCES
jgi:Protein of unknown function (DUF1524)/Excalibur calcium-binding domain